MRTITRRWAVPIAAIIAVIFSFQLALATRTHDPLAHAAGDDAGCVFCTFSHASEVGSPVVAELLPPAPTYLPACAAPRAPHVSDHDVVRLARGPPPSNA